MIVTCPNTLGLKQTFSLKENYMRILITLYFLTGMSFYTTAQNSFSFGAKIGYGTSALPMNAVLHINGTAFPAKSGATLSTGIIGRYMISDLIGIETGAYANHYSFYKTENFRNRERYWKTAADLEVLNYQLPILLNCKLKLPQRPFSYFMFSAGTTIDWFFPDLLTGHTSAFRPRAFQNLFASIKSGREKLRGKMELGIDLQYSFRHFDFTNRNYGFTGTLVHSKLNMVSLNLAYFFMTRQINSQSS
jgi:hypothetical protein